MNSKQYSFRNTEKWDVEGLAEQTGVSVSQLVKKALLEYAANHGFELKSNKILTLKDIVGSQN